MHKKIPLIMAGIFLTGALSFSVLTIMDLYPYVDLQKKTEKLREEFTSVYDKSDPTEPSAVNGSKKKKEAARQSIDPILDRNIDLDRLIKLNSDCIGWIFIPDTEVDYPILQHTSDNFYYLKHSFWKKEDILGSIFTYKEFSADFAEPHPVLFGHNMRSGQMFGQLSDYQEQTFLEKHPYVYLYLPKKNIKYQVISVYECGIDDPLYRIGYHRGTKAYADLAACVSDVLTPFQILTLSTCSENGDASRRFVVNCIPVMVKKK